MFFIHSKQKNPNSLFRNASTGISPAANILRLAAISRADRALRRKCEPKHFALQSAVPRLGRGHQQKSHRICGGRPPTGISPAANILRLAAISRADRALRRKCEPKRFALQSAVPRLGRGHQQKSHRKSGGFSAGEARPFISEPLFAAARISSRVVWTGSLR